MNESIIKSTNQGKLVGTIVSDPILSHSAYDENFYEIMLEVKRLSGAADVIPVCYSDRLIHDLSFLQQGNTIQVDGEFRSRNQILDNKSRLLLSFFAKNICPQNLDVKETNTLKLTGFICKPPLYRTTPFNREICDLLVAVNRPFKKRSDYIPCLAWGRNARFASDLPVGVGVDIDGRIQSRPYEKKTDAGIENHVAYEVSIKFISAIEGSRTIFPNAESEEAQN